MLHILQSLHAAGRITDLDYHFTRFLSEKGGEHTPEVLLATCLVSHWTGNGNVCVHLPALAEQALFEGEDEVEPLPAPALKIWTAALRRSPLVGRPGDFRPLILDRRQRLYLYRYWDYEQRLAAQLLARAEVLDSDIDPQRLTADLARHFGPPGDAVDWQKVAAATAVLRRLCVISGGPGTGKTSTVLRVLALLLGQAGERPPVIALAAPTGKAAARMQEAIRATVQQLDLPPELRAALPERAQTIHRLLGVLPDGVNFQHHRENPLLLDVLIVDEASMVDLALMTRLIEALPLNARLILLGDKDQLASVEAGSVLGDICGRVPGFSAEFRERLVALTGEALPSDRPGRSPLSDCVLQLRHSYRFGSDSGIGRLARAINAGKSAAALRLLRGKTFPEVRWRGLSGRNVSEQLALRLAEGFAPYLRLLHEGGPVPEILAAFERFRVLCALRNGPFGVSGLNRAIERELERRRLIPARLRRGDGPWYPGRPVLITRNDYNLQLYNGDIGLTLADATGRLRVVFPGPNATLRWLLPGRLPDHETVYAMTVHKSQGSEFDKVLIILPPEDNRVLGRELLYTAITRARHDVELWATPLSFEAAVARRMQRASGLGDHLWSRSRAMKAPLPARERGAEG